MAAADLFVLLERELHRRRSRECGECRVALPFRVDLHGDDGPNWQTMIATDACGQGCEAVLEEITAELQALYVLKSAT